MKVFLGGTCNNSLWRNNLIPKLDIDFFNPVVETWTDEAYKLEIKAKNTSEYFLYVLTPKYTGFYSFAEVIDEAFHFANRTIFCFLTEDGNEIATQEQIDSFTWLGEKVVDNGGLWLDNLDEVAHFLNSSSKPAAQLDRYDLFISYGRKHSSTLASKLRHSLNKKDKLVWLDKFNIPIGVDFQESINEGIRLSDNFVYIISPHSVKSEYCSKELELAIAYGKRIIPIMHVPEDGIEAYMIPEVQKLNWIYFDSDRKFQHSLSELIQLTELDRDYIEEHSKWLNKAVEWNTHEKKKDFLLGDTEVILSLNWLEETLEKEKKPAPSELHKDFIEESNLEMLARIKKKKRNAFIIKILSVLAIIGFIVAAIFLILSIKQGHINEKQKVENEKQSNVLDLTKSELNQKEIDLANISSSLELKENQLDQLEDKLVQKNDSLGIISSSLGETKAILKSEQTKLLFKENELTGKNTALNALGDSLEIIGESLSLSQGNLDTLVGRLLSTELFKLSKEYASGNRLLNQDEQELIRKIAKYAYKLDKSYNLGTLSNDAYLTFKKYSQNKNFSHVVHDKAITKIITCNNYYLTLDIGGRLNLWDKDKLLFSTKGSEKFTKLSTNPKGDIALIGTENKIYKINIINNFIQFTDSLQIDSELKDIALADNGEYILSSSNQLILGRMTDKSIGLPQKFIEISTMKNSKVAINGIYKMYTTDNLLYILDAQGKSQSIGNQITNQISEIHISKSGFAYIGDEKGLIYSYNLKAGNKGTMNHFTEQHYFEPTKIWYDEVHQTLVTSSLDNTLRIWPINQKNGTPNGMESAVVNFESWPRDFIVSQDKNWILVVGEQKKIQFLPSNYHFIYDEMNDEDITDFEQLEEYIKANYWMIEYFKNKTNENR